MSLIRDVITYANDCDLDAYILIIDQVKAFDRVDRPFLERVLKQFGFGPNLIKLVKTTNAFTTACIKANGKLSRNFNTTRGVRQGCPLSAPLYVIVAEVLAAAIRNDQNIKPIIYENEQCKVSQYADDTTLFLTSASSLQPLQQILQNYQQASKVHPEKCEGLWLGRNWGRTDSPGIYKWTNHSLCILGLDFGNANHSETVWPRKVESFKKTLRLWQYRNLSLKGRKIFINQLAFWERW